MREEVEVIHYYVFYGKTLTGYGPSMDPHRCGDPTEPCWKVRKTRWVGEWVSEVIDVKDDRMDTDVKDQDKAGESNEV